jgi:DNA processing protein
MSEHWLTDNECSPWRAAVDLVTPVPPSPVREAERQVDVAGSIAQKFAGIAGLPLYKAALRREAGERASHASLDNLRWQYRATSKAQHLVKGRVVLLVDDVVTTGNTARVCAELLRSAGASAIYVLAVAQAETSVRESRYLGDRAAEQVAALAPWLCLARTPDLGPVRVRALLERFGSPGQVLAVREAELMSVRKIGPKLSAAIRLQATRKDDYSEIAAREIAFAHRTVGGAILTTQEPGYPCILRASAHAVPVLYCAGRQSGGSSSERTVAIVGSRKPTPTVAEIARAVAQSLSQKGWIVLSGLAEGCDSLAHQGALAGNGPTWAFLGCGVDQIYPPSNKALREQILVEGRLFSEYTFGTRVTQDFLRKRNNLIVGAARAVIILQTELDGGTMNAARSAITQGRPTLCLPPMEEPDRFSGNAVLLRDRKAEQLDPDRAVAQIEAVVAG